MKYLAGEWGDRLQVDRDVWPKFKSSMYPYKDLSGGDIGNLTRIDNP